MQPRVSCWAIPSMVIKSTNHCHLKSLVFQDYCKLIWNSNNVSEWANSNWALAITDIQFMHAHVHMLRFRLVWNESHHILSNIHMKSKQDLNWVFIVIKNCLNHFAHFICSDRLNIHGYRNVQQQIRGCAEMNENIWST